MQYVIVRFDKSGKFGEVVGFTTSKPFADRMVGGLNNKMLSYMYLVVKMPVMSSCNVNKDTVTLDIKSKATFALEKIIDALCL